MIRCDDGNNLDWRIKSINDVNNTFLFKFEEYTEPKGWTGKVVCVALPAGNYFTVGKIYDVIDGKLIRDDGVYWNTIRVDSVDEIISALNKYYTFIEYKGEVVPKGWNAKVICTQRDQGCGFFEIGKLYSVIHGIVCNENRPYITSKFVCSLIDLNNTVHSYKFIELIP